MSKYVLHGGYVISRYDGQRHYVGPVQLARLYGLNLRDCALIRSEMPGSQYPPDAVHLYPRNDGELPLACRRPALPLPGRPGRERWR